MKDAERLEHIGLKILDIIQRDYAFDIPLNCQQACVYLGISNWKLNDLVAHGRLKKKVAHGLSGYMVKDLNEIKLTIK